MEDEQKYKITIKPFSDGKLIHAYESNPEFGYVVLESDEPFFCPTLFDVYLKSSDIKSFKSPKRQAFLRGSIERLEKLVDATIVKNLPGRIRITEYLEDEIPEDVKKANIRDDIPFEEAIKPYLLMFKPKNDSIENRIRDRFREKSNDKFLTKKGKRIVRLFIYQGDNKEDLLIKGFDIEFEPKTPIFTGIDVPVKEPEEEETNENSLSQNTERSLASVKRENAVMIPLVAILVLGVILTLIMVPSLATTVGIIFGALILFFFAGWAYQMFFHGEREFSMLRSLVSGVVVILIIALIIFIMDVTKTPNDPDMWRHP